MVSKRDLGIYGFENMSDYYEYVVKSEINGQRGQVNDLISAMSAEQKKGCLAYLEDLVGHDFNIVRGLVIKSL